MNADELRAIRERALKATQGPILEREDQDYYQGGTYIGVGEYDICRMEEGDNKENDINLFKNARKDILDLIAYIAELQKKEPQ
jgi:hypothetical protein